MKGNWWEFTNDNKLDPKIARLGYQLVSYLLKDRLGSSFDNLVKTLKIKLFDWSGDVALSTLFESLGFKIEVIKTAEAPFLLAGPLRTHQLIIFHHLLVSLSKPIFQNLENFLNQGGRLICFFCSATSLSPLFGNYIQEQPHSTVISAKMKITNEKELFSAFPDSSEIELDLSRPPFLVTDEKHTSVLAKVAARNLEPVLVKVPFQNGLIYVFSSKLFLSKKVSR